jgi:plastocyanin
MTRTGPPRTPSAPFGRPAGKVNVDMRRTRTIVTVLATILAAAFLLAGCGSGSGTTTTPPAADSISISNFKFAPSSLTVAPGTKITVTNHDTATHTVTATTNKAFDTGNISGGATTTFTAPTTPGTYNYICSIHTYMTGTLIVK